VVKVFDLPQVQSRVVRKDFHSGRPFLPILKALSLLRIQNEDLALHDRMWCCPACGETYDRDVNASINLYFVGIGRPEVTPVEQALVDDRSPNGLPKKPSCDETGSLTSYG